MVLPGYSTDSIENDQIHLEYLTRGALRIVRLQAFNSPNLLAKVPDIEWQTPNGIYRMLGGHRLWVSPEIPEITYLPEQPEIQVELMDGGVRLTQPTDPRCGLQKTIEIHLPPQGAVFTLRHFLMNNSSHPLRIAAWAITQFTPGGMGAFPQSSTPVDPGGFLPNRSLALWPYTRLDDPRLRWLKNYLILWADPIEQPAKLGCFLSSGRGYYYTQGLLICKQVAVQPAAIYPDYSSVMEMYTNSRFLELESLSPLMDLNPGNQIIHEETFSLVPAPDIVDEHDLAAFLDSLEQQFFPPA